MVEKIRERAISLIENSARKDKIRFDKSKARVHKFSVGDLVVENHERNQTKLDPKFRGPFKVIEVCEGDRYVLKALDNKRTLCTRTPSCYVCMRHMCLFPRN